MIEGMTDSAGARGYTTARWSCGSAAKAKLAALATAVRHQETAPARPSLHGNAMPNDGVVVLECAVRLRSQDERIGARAPWWNAQAPELYTRGQRSGWRSSLQGSFGYGDGSEYRLACAVWPARGTAVVKIGKHVLPEPGRFDEQDLVALVDAR